MTTRNRVRGHRLMKLFRAYYRLWVRHQIPMRAAALTYTFILGLVPALAVCLSIFSVLFDVRRLSGDFKIFLLKHLAAGAGDTVTRYLDLFLANVRFKTIGYVGFAALLIAALLLLSSIEEAINRIWAIRRKKALWARVLIYNMILLLGPICVSLSIATTTIVTKYFPQFLFKANLSTVAVSMIFLSLTYKIFPNKKVSWRAALISGGFVAITAELAKWGYAIYTTKALFNNKIYGGLAALPVFLVWVYVNWTIFLAGALLCFVIQHHSSFKVRGPQ
jgi:membrane protein